MENQTYTAIKDSEEENNDDYCLCWLLFCIFKIN